MAMQRILSGSVACTSCSTNVQGNPRIAQSKRTVLLHRLVARANPQPEQKEDVEEDVVNMENLVRSGSKAKREERKKARLASGTPYTLKTGTRDQITEADVTEGQFLSALFFIFIILMLEGLLVGASGFLPEAADQFVQDYIYKAFTPTVGLFLACSTAYGLWKTRNDNAKSGEK